MRAQIVQQEGLSSLKWTVLIFGFFVIQAILWTAAIGFTMTDHSHAVVAGYDEKAIGWEQQRALDRSSVALGWSAQLSVEPGGDIRSFRTIQLRLVDASSQAIEDAEIELSLFHCGRVGDVQAIDCRPVGPGLYEGQVKIDKDGLWQMSGRAVRQDKVFLIDDRQFLRREKH